MTLLAAQNLSVQAGKKQLVQAVSLDVKAGELLVVVGPNGAGKTTLLKGLAGLISPSSGQVYLQQKPLKAFSATQRARMLAYLPQHPPCHWQLKVRDVVALGRMPCLDKTGDEGAVECAMAECDVAQFAQRPLHSLSGGEQARVHLARALCGQAPLLLADEPISSLDPYHQFAMLRLLQLRAQKGIGIVVVLHDLALAARYASRIAVMQNGRLLICDSPEKALNSALVADVFGVEMVRDAHNNLQVAGLSPHGGDMISIKEDQSAL